MTYIFNFKAKIINLDIEVSESYIEGIRINSCEQDRRTRQNSGTVVFLCAGDYDRLGHLYSLVNLIDDYFSGKIVNFSKIPVDFVSYSNFTKKILIALRAVKYGETLSYKYLALKAGFSARYSRACASALSINRTPIILPCHRIIYSNNKLGGYSAAGLSLKNKLISLEHTAISL